jgi:hypothetical protein
MADPVTVIQATLAPIFLVSGAAIFLNFTQARLFRVVDRLRGLAKDLQGAGGEARGSLLAQRVRNLRRAILLRNSILMGVLVIAFTVATTLLLLIPTGFEGTDPGRWPIVTFAAALVCFAVALFLVALDAILSVAAVRYHDQEFPERS